jgi:hypothetical protein
MPLGAAPASDPKPNCAPTLTPAQYVSSADSGQSTSYEHRTRSCFRVFHPKVRAAGCGRVDLSV